MFIICCGMLRAASTLQYQIASDLVERAGLGQRVGWLEGGDLERAVGGNDRKGQLLVLKTHSYDSALGGMLDAGDARALYSYRDLRDVSVSACRKFGMDFDTFMAKRWLAAAIADGRR